MWARFEWTLGGWGLGSESRSECLRVELEMRPESQAPVSHRGFVEPAFKRVERQFSKLLQREPRGGGALCIYYEGRCVVDLQGGVRNAAAEPWTTALAAGRNELPSRGPRPQPPPPPPEPYPVPRLQIGLGPKF